MEGRHLGKSNFYNATGDPGGGEGTLSFKKKGIISFFIMKNNKREFVRKKRELLTLPEKKRRFRR